MLMRSDVIKTSVLAAGKFFFFGGAGHSFKELALETSIGGRAQAQSENHGRGTVQRSEFCSLCSNRGLFSM